jgi:hypothetical protein
MKLGNKNVIEMWPFGRKFKNIYVNGDITLYYSHRGIGINIPITEIDMKNLEKDFERGIERMEIHILWKD